ncbi:MAG: protein kinase domain-containing protein [Kofleriaceae bacterium]
MECPDDNVLVEMVERAIEPAAMRDLEEHLDSCESCRDVVAALAIGSKDRSKSRTPGAAWVGVDHPELLENETIAGRYVLAKILGRGGMGTVYLARDLTLGRDVALKLHHAGSGNARLQREAVAMAKLAHPNVVTVYDVGTVGDRTYVAMEYVHGAGDGPVTLRGYLAKPRTWREILAVLLDAGTGLAAAHTAGLIHRDFKPDNVLVGADGRARVSDFGLAHLASRAPAKVASSGRALDVGVMDATMRAPSQPLAEGTPLTETGAVLGTPAYMAPEQASGGAVDARSDQFAFCLVAWEALLGTRPFAGTTLPAIQLAIEAQDFQPPKKADGDAGTHRRSEQVPSEIIREMKRGLAVDPAARHADMPALIAALRKAAARRSRRVRRGAIAAVAVLALGGGGFAAASAIGSHRREAACVAEGAEVRALVGDDARTKMRGAFLASGSPLADVVVERATGTLAKAANALGDQVAAVCRTREEPSPLQAARQACLADRQGRIAKLVETYSGTVDAAMVRRATDAAWASFEPTPCSDATTLSKTAMSPAHAETLGRIKAMTDAAQYKEAVATATRLLADTKVTTPAMEIDVLIARGNANEQIDSDAAIADFYKVLALAEAQGRDFEAAIALDTLANIAGVDKHEYDAAHRFVDLARAKIQRLGGTNLVIYGKVLTTEAQILLDENRLGEAQVSIEKAISIFEEVYGAEHPNVGLANGTLSHVMRFQDKTPEALAAAERTLKILEATLGPENPKAAGALMTVGQSWSDTGEFDKARDAFTRADAVFRRVFGEIHRTRAAALGNLGGLELRMKNYEAARAAFAVALEITVKNEGPDGRSVSGVQMDHARALAGLGRWDDAKAALDEAIRVLTKLGKDGEPWLGGALFDMANLELDRGRPAAALTWAEKSLALVTSRPGDANQLDVAEAQFSLARALVESGGDRVRAKQLVADALKHPVPERRAEITAWLASHPL